MIMLYMIGVKPEFLKERQVFVPESMRNTILTMCTDIINENDKEHVSSLGVREKRLYMNVVSESEKVQILGEAAALKNCVSQLNTCQDIIREEYEVLNPVWRNYFSLCVKYKCGLETK